MVLHGIKDSTSDIDLGCNSSMADELMRDGFFVRLTESGNRQFKYGEHIEIFENWLNDSVTSVDGLPVISIKGLIEMKQELGRDKDYKDIALIEEYLAGKGAISAQ